MKNNILLILALSTSNMAIAEEKDEHREHAVAEEGHHVEHDLAQPERTTRGRAERGECDDDTWWRARACASVRIDRTRLQSSNRD